MKTAILWLIYPWLDVFPCGDLLKRLAQEKLPQAA
jgi:hypothetical protein